MRVTIYFLSLLITTSCVAQQVTRHVIPTKSYNWPRRVWVYTPAGYQKDQGNNNLLVVFDGQQYLDEMPLPKILDSLIRVKSIAPTVALLIDDSVHSVRLDDLANRESFATFVAKEVMPWVRANYNVTSDPAKSALTGSSAGGLASVFIAFRHPELFGKVFSQSGAFWRGAEASNDPPYEWLTEQFKKSPNVGVEFVLDVGEMETGGTLGGAGPSILSATRRLHNVMADKKYKVQYTEVAGGFHAPESWNRRLAFGLTAILK